MFWIWHSIISMLINLMTGWARLNKERGSQQNKNTVTMETKSLQVLKNLNIDGLCQKIK